MLFVDLFRDGVSRLELFQRVWQPSNRVPLPLLDEPRWIAIDFEPVFLRVFLER